ncbi:hypothetical protein K438DRAFT_1987178 [Mycena galopus ATCC 62051]|nr:hypothetical protein K438DRAFT_1987178 [Mycena galopus ATCC 62051]
MEGLDNSTQPDAPRSGPFPEQTRPGSNSMNNHASVSYTQQFTRKMFILTIFKGYHPHGPPGPFPDQSLSGGNMVNTYSSAYLPQQYSQFSSSMFGQMLTPDDMGLMNPGYYGQHPFDQPNGQHRPTFYQNQPNGQIVSEPVTTRSQNYPDALPTLTQIQDTIKSMQMQLNDAKLRAEKSEIATHESRSQSQKFARKNSLRNRAKKSRVQALIHNKSRWALGLGLANNDDEDDISNKLPGPLQPGEDPTMLRDGKTPKAHPNWRVGVADPVNRQFLERITDLAMESINADTASLTNDYGAPDRQDVMKSVKVFFNHLRKVWMRQTSMEGQERYRRKLTVNKRRARKHEKADDHRRAVPRFREKFGEEQTIGDIAAIQTDYMSSERSDCGNVEPAVFNAHRTKSGGGEHGWATRQKAWHSRWLNLYFAHLKTIRREMLEEEKENSLGASGSAAGKHRVPRFKGLAANTNHSTPTAARTQPLYEGMVSQTWLQKQKKTYEEIGAVAAPAHLTLFHLDLDTVGLHQTEVDYLADDES